MQHKIYIFGSYVKIASILFFDEIDEILCDEF